MFAYQITALDGSNDEGKGEIALTFAELKAALEGDLKGDKETMSYLAGLFPVTAESAKAFLETDEGKRLLQPMLDSYHSKGLETWKTNNLDRLVSELHDKKFPPEDEKDKALRDMRKELDDIKRDKIRSDLMASAMKTATEKGLPVGVIGHFIGEDEETTNANLSAFEAAFNATVEAKVNTVFKERGIEPKKGGDPDPDKNKPNPWKKETENLTEQGRILRADPEKAAKLKAEAGVQ